MKKIINIHYALPLLFFVLVGVFSFNFNTQDITSTTVFELPTVEAFGSSGGPGGGPGGGGGNDSGCGGCGGGSEGGGNNGGPDGGQGNPFVIGCMDPNATNYNPNATIPNNSQCVYPEVPGCMDISAINYNPNATVDNGSCEYPVVTSCDLTASADIIENNASVTLSWETEGFETIKLNGQIVSGPTGEKTFYNVTEDTTYTLVATNSNGDRCATNVYVQCLPPVIEKKCELDINKSVNKSTAKVGEEVTYTINVKNIGNGDCTGGGVKIFDVVDKNLIYKSHTLTSNLTAGYGNMPVYSSSDRTLRFNGNTLTPGESGTISWTGQIASPSQCGDFLVQNQAKTTAKELNNFGTWIYSQKVQTNIDNDCVVPLPKCDFLNASPTSFNYGGGNTTLTWGTTHATKVHISGIGEVALDNSTGRVVSVPDTRTFVLTATNADGKTDKSCVQKVTVHPKVDKPLPKCDFFTASPTSFNYGGGNTTLTWGTTHATKVHISGIGEVALDNSTGRVVSVPDTRTFVLTATNAEGKEDKSCVQKVTVHPKVDKPLPKCDFLNASPTSFNYGGGNTTLTWGTTHATKVHISGIGEVALDNSTGRVVSVSDTRTFVLTATNADGKTDKSCVQKVTVLPKEPVFSCENNVNFSVSDSSIRRGTSVTLKWSTFDVDSLNISNINRTELSGNVSVSPSSDITYTLTANSNGKTIHCPVTVDVSTGGGGGGTKIPRCDLDISDKKIKAGEEATLSWRTSNTIDIIIKDNRGKTIFTTDKYSSQDKRDYLDSSIKVSPTKDTKYTLTAIRGGRDRDCSVSIKVGDENVVVLEDRDQLPLVSGISLTQVPYTGFEAGPFMTTLFYLLLVAWSLFITYLLVIRNRVAPATVKTYSPSDKSQATKDSMKKAEAIRPDVFAPSVMSKVVASQTTPTNLPTAVAVAGQDVMRTQETVNTNSDTVVTSLENRAHSQKALLSSDAVQHFVTATKDLNERDQMLDQVIAQAKETYPLEDGWIVINESRMQSLCQECVTDTVTQTTTATEAGASSLAEAIVTGNIVAAYQMIGHRPMIALADAAADLDAVYRNRQGENNSVSQLLSTQTQNLFDQQISQMIASLTGALDGTYTDEAAAVKMSIMKAVKVAA